ncbi:MAG: arginine deiminase family protein [Acidobacteriota bacterium]
MSFGVYSETARLRRVLIHRPGREIDWMVPSLMDRLLFDDILYGEDARWEHDIFRAVLEAAGVETLDPQDLLADVLAESEIRARALDDVARSGIADDVLETLSAAEPRELAAHLVSGMRAVDELPGERLRHFYRLSPVPNYFFQRDPQVVMGDMVLRSSMATDARRREPWLSSIVFEHHPAVSGWTERIRLDDEESAFRRQPWIEGGDVLIPSSDVLMVGVSERTNRYGIDRLARHLLGRDDGFRHLVVVEIPARRSYMHLDTVFTFIDEGICLGYLPVVAPGGVEGGDVYRIDLGAPEVAYTLCDDLPSALARVGVEVDEIIPCGSDDSLIDQQREQWTDGANAFALAPGVICLYRRNRRTAEGLARRGWTVIDGEEVAEGTVDPLAGGRTVITLPDNELSRARGGPRCMTMPLLRDRFA